MTDNTVTLVGTLGADPELRRTPQGKDVVNFSLVTNERVRGADGTWADGAASWFRVAAWNALGRNAAMSFRKGHRVIVRGTLKVEQWQAKDGGTGKTVVLTAAALGHDLLWGSSTFVRGATVAAQQPEQASIRSEEPGGWGAAPGTAQQRETVPAAAQDEWAGALEPDETPF